VASARTVAVHLKAVVGQYKAEIRSAAKETQGLDTAVKKAGAQSKNLGRDLDAAAKSTGKSTGKIKGALGGVESAADKMGFGVKLAGAAAGAAMIALAKDSLGAASDLNEQISATKTIFGDAADAVIRFGESADAIGLSETAALRASTAFGDLFTKIGYTDEAAATFSVDLVRMAADFASFKDLDPNDVLGKLKSGLSGESEPLRDLGVFINEAKVQAEGMRLGLVDAHGEMGDGEKIAARYKIIMDEMGDAYGDVGRTADSYANTQRRASAEFENLKASIGQQLLPIAADASFLLSELSDALGGVSDSANGAGDGLDWLERKLGKTSEHAVYGKSGFELLADALRALKGEEDETAESSEYLADSMETLADKNARVRKNTQESTKAIEEQVKALEDLLDATKSQFSSEIDYKQAVLGIADDIDKYNESLRANKDGKADNDVTSRELQEQELQLRDALLGAADAAVRQAEDNAAAAGRTLTEVEKYDTFRDALLKLKDQFPQLGSRIDEYVARLGSVPASKRTEVGLTGWELAQVRAKTLADTLALLPSFKNITVRYDEILGTTVQRGGYGGRVTENAAGNLYEQHTAQIAPGGAMRLWAEPETGGEAYIPLAPSKRARSLAIWEETGRRLEAFAIGGIRGMDFRDDARLDTSQVRDLRGKKFNPREAYWRTYLAQMQKYRNVRAFADGGFVGSRFLGGPASAGSTNSGPMALVGGDLHIHGRADRETMLEVKHALTDVAFHS
jgi:hypothetical protein